MLNFVFRYKHTCLGNPRKSNIKLKISDLWIAYFVLHNSLLSIN